MSATLSISEQVGLIVEVLSSLPPEIWNNVPDSAWALFWYNLFEQIWIQQILWMLAASVSIYIVTLAFSKIMHTVLRLGNKEEGPQ